jgi:hypothetical protein
VSRQSLTNAHAEMTKLRWNPTFATAAARFGTDYTLEKPPKDPLDLCQPPRHLDQATAARELEAISQRRPDMTRPVGGTGRHRPLVAMALEVARELCRVGSQADLSVTVPNSFNSCAMNHASLRKETTSPRVTRCRSGAGRTESRMDGIGHVAVALSDTDLSDLWSLR